MNYTKAKLVSALALNQPEAEKLERELQEKIDAVNAFIKKGETPSAASLVELGAKEDELEPFSMWCDTLQCLINYCDKERVSVLTDEQARIALTKARNFTHWGDKVNSNTGYYEKRGTQKKIDLIGMFARLGVDLSEFRKYFPCLTLSLALLANDRLESKTPTEDIIANFKSDEEVKRRLISGADFKSRNSVCKSLDACINAYVPSAGYKSFKRDVERMYIDGTQVSRKDFSDIKAGIAKKVLEAFLDYVSKLLNSDGKVMYNVKYKTTKIEAKAYEMLIEEPATEDAPVAEAPAAEPVAAKPVKEPKSKKEPTSKRGSKGAKKSDKTAA